MATQTKSAKKSEVVAGMPVIAGGKKSGSVGSVATAAANGLIETTTTTTEDKEEIFIATPYLKALDSPSPKSPAIHFHDNSSATDVLGYREEEKREMQRLNNRLAEYIEMVHFLQGENKMLREKLKQQGVPVVIGTNNEEFYKAKQEEFMRLKTEMEREIDKLRRELQEFQSKYNHMKRELDTEKSKLEVILKLEREGFERELEKNRHDYIERLAALEKHYETMRRAYEEQIGDILGKDKHEENQAYFRHEISEAIREIRRMNDAILESKKQHLERFYQRKVQELESNRVQSDSEINYYRKRVTSLEQLLLEQRNEFESRIIVLEESLKGKDSQNVSHKDCVEIINERNRDIQELKISLNDIKEDRDKLLSTKLTLIEEIETYKQLLESVDFSYTPKAKEGVDESYTEGEVRVKTQYRQTSIGSVAIRTDTQGAFILVENTKGPAPEDTNMDGWVIEQKVDRGDSVRFSFPRNFILLANKSIKVWSKSAGHSASADNLVANNGWLTGDKMTTTLRDNSGAEVSTFSQDSVKTTQGTVV